MDLTPGSTARDSRSLSVEAAQYDAQAHDAEAELRQLEAKVKAIRDEAEQARLAKKETEAAREKAFQAERQERQVAVRNSINDHVLEGLRRFLDNEQKEDAKATVKRLAVGRTTVLTDMVKFHSIILEELTGSLDDSEFWRSLASRVLEKPELVVITEKKQGARSHGVTPGPKYDNLTQSPMSPKPAQNPPRSPTSQHLLTSPKTSLYVRKESPELGSEENVKVNGLVESALPEFMTLTDSSVADANFTIGEDILENIGATNEEDAKQNMTSEVHEEHEVAGIEKTVTDTESRDVVDLNGDDTAPVPEYDFVMDEQAVDANAESNELEQAGNFMAGVEYNTIEQKNATAFGDGVIKSEPLDFADTDSTAKSKHKDLDPDNFAWANVPPTATTDRRQNTASNDSGFAVPLTPRPTATSQPAVMPLSVATPHKKAVTSGQKATPVSKKPSVKRKRQGSEVNESSVSVVVTPANKKGKTKATEVDASAETPSKKGKGKAKDDGSGMILFAPSLSSYAHHSHHSASTHPSHHQKYEEAVTTGPSKGTCLLFLRAGPKTSTPVPLQSHVLRDVLEVCGEVFGWKETFRSAV
jgi:hypothetical protein